MAAVLVTGFFVGFGRYFALLAITNVICCVMLVLVSM